MTLRDYQRAAVDSVWRYWETAPRGSSPLIVAPTGSGKSWILAALCSDLVQRGAQVLVATHRAELITQDEAAIRGLWPLAPVGVLSSSLGRSEIRQITVCGIQTAARRLNSLGRRHVMIVDEAHMVGAGGQYRSVVNALRIECPDMRAIGLTATPYREGQGYLTEGDNPLFSAICHEITIDELLDAGHLAPVVTGAASASIDTSAVSTRMGDFALADLELISDVDAINEAVARDVSEQLRRRRCAIVFGVSVAHCSRIRNALQVLGVAAVVVTGDTPHDERKRIYVAAKRGEVRALISCGVLTTGFDLPIVDVVALVRPTKSASLYVQMIGRGMRTAEGKSDCLVLDYGGCIARLGPVDKVRIRPRRESSDDGTVPIKICPQCCAQQATAVRQCEHCGYQWPAPISKATPAASTKAVLSRQQCAELEDEHAIVDSRWAKHVKKGADEAAPCTLRIDHYTSSSSYRPAISEYVCLEHTGFARTKAEAWWSARCTTRCPDDVTAALDDLEGGAMRSIKSIRVQPDPANAKFQRVTAFAFRDVDDPSIVPEPIGYVEDECPF